jgi:hypothetical protein
MLLLLVTITGIVMSFTESVLCAGELPGAHTEKVSNAHNEQQIQGNMVSSDPSQPQPTNDHTCLGDCGCPCNAPLLSWSSLSLVNSHQLTVVYHPERNPYIPEVYLSLFVPPDSSTV